MKLINRQTQAEAALDRWLEQYPRDILPMAYHHVATRKLEAYFLSHKPLDPDEVDRIIGNGSWTSVPECSVCGGRKEALAQFYDDIEDTEFGVCSECLEKALALLKK